MSGDAVHLGFTPWFDTKLFNLLYDPSIATCQELRANTITHQLGVPSVLQSIDGSTTNSYKPVTSITLLSTFAPKKKKLPVTPYTKRRDILEKGK